MTDPTAFAVCIPFAVFAVVAVIARFISRGKSAVNFALDDWLMIPALILSLGHVGNVLWSAIDGHLGQHMPVGPDGQIAFGPYMEILLISGYVSELLVTTAISIVRVSIILFYMRIFAGPKFRAWAIAMMVINVVWFLVFIFLYAFQCNPPSEFWSMDQHARKHCIDNIINVPYAFTSIFLDIAVLCMPWPMVWGLQLRLRQKIAVLGIFMLGGVVVAVSIGKTYAFATVFQNLEATHDYTFFEAPLLYWTVPEVCLSVVCACLPTLRPLFAGMSPESMIRSLRSLLTLRSTSSRSHASTSNTYASHTAHSGQSNNYILRSDEHHVYESYVGMPDSRDQHSGHSWGPPADRSGRVYGYGKEMPLSPYDSDHMEMKGATSPRGPLGRGF